MNISILADCWNKLAVSWNISGFDNNWFPQLSKRKLWEVYGIWFTVLLTVIDILFEEKFTIVYYDWYYYWKMFTKLQTTALVFHDAMEWENVTAFLKERVS